VSTLLVTPLLAGLVAYDRSRRLEPTMTLLGAASPRGRQGALALVAASWLVTVAAWVAAIGYAALRAAASGAAGLPDPWVFIEAPAVLFLGACVGLAIGSVVAGLLAGPLAAIAVYLGEIFGDSLRMEGVFQAAPVTGSLVTLERTPANAAALIALHCALAISALAFALTDAPGTRRLRPGSIAPITTSLLLVFTAAGGVWYTSARAAPYRPVTAAQLCLGRAVVVCGPEKAEPILRIAARSLDESIVRLSGSGIDWQNRYSMQTAQPIPAEHGVLSANTEHISDGSLGRDNIIQTLGLPRLCRAYFSDQLSRPLLDDAGTVQEWVDARLDASPPVQQAPPGVTAAYARLRTCPPMTSPLR
jgi:hypothetical protein